MLTISNEDDWTLCGSHCWEGTSTFGVAIHLGDDDWPYINCLSESLGLSIALLANGAIHDEDDVVRLHCLLDLLHLIKKLSLLLVPSWCINDNDLHSLLLELSHTLLGNGNGVSFDVAAIEGDSNLGCVLFELVKGSCSECICADHGDSPPFLLVVIGNLAASGGFATALEANEHNNVGLASFGLIGFLLDFKQTA